MEENKKGKLKMKTVLILFALIPMIFTSSIMSTILVNTSRKELENATHNSFVTIIEKTGHSLDNYMRDDEVLLRSFGEADIIKDYFLDPTEENAARLKAYTNEYFHGLDGWEGLYVADWNSKVIAHPSKSVVGKTMREGKALRELQDSLKNTDGVYNTGIIQSPASGEQIISMYMAVRDDKGKPIGYVGAGTYVRDMVEKVNDIEALQLESAYIYVVDRHGTMLYHPDEAKVGNSVENAAVKGLVSRLADGETVETECVEYAYKGAMKYAAYYVGKDDSYIVVLTADEDEVMGNIKSITYITVIVAFVCVFIFALAAIALSVLIAKPLTGIAEATEILSTGDVTITCDARSNIKETVSVINAFNALKEALTNSMSEVKESAGVLETAIVNVDSMTGNNVESITQIRDAIEEVASTSQNVAENAQEMAEKAYVLGQDIEILNDSVEKLYEASISIQNANQDATDSMNDVLDGAVESVEAIDGIAQKIAETNEAVARIDAAVQAIEAIAAQTNLLSLNASIEAARAGDAGAGFAVVATEIRTLADSSAESAKDIKEIIQGVIDLSTETVELSNKVYTLIHKEQQDIRDTQGKFTILSNSVESVIGDIDSIRERAVSLDEIKNKLTQTTTELGAISEELGASAQEVAASCQEVTDACADTQASTEEMRAINEHMNESIEFFRLS